MSDPTNQAIKTCSRRTSVLVDAHVEVDPPSHVGRFAKTPEEKASELQAWVREFQDFMRDHRSQDAIHLQVIQDRISMCSACGGEWETYEEDGKTYCACCGALVVES